MEAKKMNEEELFCKLFPEYAVNGKPLSPYFDLFESGYEQAEKRIAELEKRCANYEMNISKMEKGTCDICKETEKDKKILDLEKENAELKETLRTYNGCGDWDNDFHTCRVYLQHEELQKCMEQLTKAKTYLKYFIEILKKLGANKEPLVIEAEQFLKDSEV